MTTEESNKIVAEFVGLHEIMLDMESKYEAADICQCLDLPINPLTHFKSATELISVDELNFNSSWDWLMPVGRKALIAAQEMEADEWVNGLQDMASAFNMQGLYEELVQFIEWYNQQKK